MRILENYQLCIAINNRFRNLQSAGKCGFPAAFANTDIAAFHGSLPTYTPTPLFSLPGLARRLGIRELWVKDESERFGLKAFKALGATYAVYRHLIRSGRVTPDSLYSPDNLSIPQSMTLCTATDGNHGRAVAWAAKLFGQRAVIFMPQGTVPARIRNIEAEGAEVRIVGGNYDLAVKTAAEQSAANGWHVIADTAYPGYELIPDDIMAGYLTLFREINDQIPADNNTPPFDIVFLQGGVGSFAAAGAQYYFNTYGEKSPRLIVVEPTAAACLMASAASPDGALTTSGGMDATIMAGLNCPTPSLTAWPILKHLVDVFLAIPDRFAREAMRLLYYPAREDRRIISGESGAAGLAGLCALLSEDSLAEARRAVGLSEDSRVLIISTEGDTDPINYNRIVTDE
ncbi:MAG: diaminopropionate ammonia-lyase [Candidatus Zixiibacteriota bacterium]